MHNKIFSSSSPGFDPGFPHSLLRGGRNHDCVKSQEMRRPFLSKKQLIKKFSNNVNSENNL
jgi:hypothetical protein